LSILDYHIEPMIIFEQLIDLWNCEVIYFFKLVDLLLEEHSLLRAYLVLVDDVDCSSHGGYLVDGLS